MSATPNAGAWPNLVRGGMFLCTSWQRPFLMLIGGPAHAAPAFPAVPPSLLHEAANDEPHGPEAA